jgi:hypothetical protein
VEGGCRGRDAPALRTIPTSAKRRRTRKHAEAEDLIDPFSGKEFVYKQNGPAWMFYSISEDGVDDGGQEGGKNRFEPDRVVRFPPAKIEPFEPEGVDE